MRYSISLGFIAFMSAALASSAAAQDTPHLERIEWTDVWVTGADQDDLPRVLLVGDSIVRGYYDVVDKALEGKAHCARYTTSLFMGNPDFLAELRVLLQRYRFDVIHFNNGLHGWAYSEEEYAASISPVLDCIAEYAKDAKFVWAATTPVRNASDLAIFDEKNPRVIERNRIAAEVTKTRGIPVNDLYALVESHTEYFSKDGVHFSEQGRTVLGEQVAKTIAGLLPESSTQ
ncbi:MAG: SGNH/GDSL hydrolase family protein [Candidatus Hydrogenedentes bacterium]|nr:SGNH/GDSL hydrolase family protein [Candidatus Hydrogenedentota bacterium]